MKMLIFVVVALLCVGGSMAYAFGDGVAGCSGNCTACHTISKDEAQALVKPFGQDIEVLDVKPSVVRGLYQATFRKGKDEGIVYIDFAKKYLINGNVIDAGQKNNITQDELNARKRMDVSAIHLENALVLGNPKGTTKLYLFTDPECPYCAQLHAEISKMIAQDPQLLVYVLLVPLDIHPNSGWKTDSIICSSKSDMSKAISQLERSYRKENIDQVICDQKYATAAQHQASELGIGLTPTIILPDGRIILGLKTADELFSLIKHNKAVARVAEKRTLNN